MNFQNYFDEHCYELSRTEILELNKQDTGALNNVISLLRNNCFGVLIYDDKKPAEYLVYFVDNTIKLQGICLEVSLKLINKTRMQLLLEFCKLINSQFARINIFDAFNIYQNQLRTGFEKLGYFTIGSEIKKFQGQNAVSVIDRKKGILRFPTLEKVEMYRSFFISNKKPQKFPKINDNSIYLLYDEKNNLIKIGRSKTPKVRERTLQGENPNWELLAAWDAPKKIEDELHKKFSVKRIRGEWFSLSFVELEEIKIMMKSFEQII